MTSAVILAAGEGQRLRPYTQGTPKCLVLFNGRPLIAYQIEALKSAGIKEIAIVTGFEHHQLEAYGDIRIWNQDFSETNMVASLMEARNFLESCDDVVVAYGDILYETRIIESLLKSDAQIAVTVDRGWRSLWEARMTDPLSDAETLKINGESILTEIGHKPSSYEDVQAQYMGLIKMRKQGIREMTATWDSFTDQTRFMGRSAKMMYMTDLLEALIVSGEQIHAVPIEHGWLEVDTVKDLEQYEAMIKAKSLGRLFNLPDSESK
ncbi:MAG: phosphocholine cytidylyltransferase family protein [Actinomycetes bacterium]